MNILSFNIRSFNIRPVLLAASAAAMLATGAAHARPADPNWFGPPVLKPTPPCGKLLKAANYGPGTGPKQIWVTDRELGPCPKDKDQKPIERYTGPRNTIPVY